MMKVAVLRWFQSGEETRSRKKLGSSIDGGGFYIYDSSFVLTGFFLLPQEYDDGYGTTYDDQGYESYDNNYSNQGQK